MSWRRDLRIPWKERVTNDKVLKRTAERRTGLPACADDIDIISINENNLKNEMCIRDRYRYVCFLAEFWKTTKLRQKSFSSSKTVKLFLP